MNVANPTMGLISPFIRIANENYFHLNRSITLKAIKTVKLADLAVGELAHVTGFTDANPTYAAQLMRLGLIPGTQIQVQRVAPLGDPIEIRFRGFSLAIRPHEAQCLQLSGDQ